jgi:hypothetical protein
MLSEADLMAKRATLRWLAERHPTWTHQDLAAALGMSRAWESRVAPTTASSRSPRHHGSALPLACTAHAAGYHCLPSGGRATHPGDAPRAPRELAAHPGARGDPVLLIPLLSSWERSME